jgi:phospholipase/carboxylesterase
MSARFSTDLQRTTAPSDVEDGAWYHEPARSLATATAPIAAASDVEVATSIAVSPVAELFVPDHYEPKYAYPLVVWLQGEDSGSGSFPRMMRRISDRNLMGAVVRPHAGERLEDQLAASITGLRRQYHVHSERIFLAGVGEYANQALRVALNRPEWFGGAIAISPRPAERSRLLNRYCDLPGKRVFLAAASDDPVDLQHALETQRLLWSAGMSVRACQFAAGEGIDRGVLREIDRWVITGICEAE